MYLPEMQSAVWTASPIQKQVVVMELSFGRAVQQSVGGILSNVQQMGISPVRLAAESSCKLVVLTMCAASSREEEVFVVHPRYDENLSEIPVDHTQELPACGRHVSCWI